MKKGFTLVELSIVLVIIGLLIGGILVGQSLIESAKLQSFVRQMQQYDSAIITFHSKYKVLPGDSALTFATSSTIGRKDGLLTDDNFVNDTTGYTRSYSTPSDQYMMLYTDLAILHGTKIENCPDLGTRPADNSLSWIQISGAKCNTAHAVYGENKNIAIMPGAFSTALGGGTSTQIAPDNTSGNSFYMMDCSMQTSQLIDCQTPYTQVEAMAIDQKIDDGIPNAGQVRAGTRTSGNINRVLLSQYSYATTYSTTSSNKMTVIKRFPNGL